MKIGIIGAGIAGIATSIRLAAQGHQVTVFEANDYPGGKLSQFEQDGFRFDAGPSLFTMPQYVTELFQLAGETPEEHFHYERIKRNCVYLWPDGTRLDAWADPEEFARETEQKLGASAGRVSRFLKKSQKKYALAGWIFLEKSLHKPQTWFRWPVLRALFRLPYFDLFTPMHRVHEKWFQNPKLTQLFDRYATYNGSNPFKAPGMLTIIPHFEHNVGVFYPEGGMYRITQSLFELAKRKGVNFHLNSPVQEILVKKGKVSGLSTRGQNLEFDAVVSNMDVFYTYRKLLPKEAAPEPILRQPKSTSALIFYWGVKGSFPELDLHNIFFSEDYKAEFEALENGKVVEDATIYLNITSKYTPSDAPEGHECWFILINVPCNKGQNWDQWIPEIKAHTIRKLERMLGRAIGSNIVTEAVLDPRSIDQKTASHLGALYGYSSNTQMSAFMRHPNFSRKIENLYFVGGSVHPGGGIPLCLLSAKITAEIIN